MGILFSSFSLCSSVILSTKPVIMPDQPSFLRSLTIIHNALLAVQILLAAIAYSLWHFDIMTASLRELDQALQVVAILLCGSAFLFGARLFRRRVEKARDSGETAAGKAAAYRSAVLFQWGLLEGASLFSIISFLLVGNLSFLLLALTLMFFFFLSRPSKIKLLLLLRLNEHEIEDLSL